MNTLEGISALRLKKRSLRGSSRGEFLGELRLGGKKLRVPAICGSVMGADLGQMEMGISRAIELGADLVELRIDGMRNRAGWEKLLRADPPIILTNRPKREGGRFEGNERERIEVLSRGISRGVSCIDIEFSTPKPKRRRLVSGAREAGVTVLMSHHDRSKTPSIEKLVDLAKRLAETGCDLAKVVSFARNYRDALRVMDFLARVGEEVKVPIISFAMGHAGRITRIAAPLLGSPIVYAAAGEATAPGQFDIKTTKRLLQELGVRE